MTDAARPDCALEDHRITHRVRVRYCETDRMGLAHHGGHIDWVEEARTEWLRAWGVSYRELEDEGYLLQVIEVRARYTGPVTYDDVVVIETSLQDARKVSMTLAYRLSRESDGAPVAEITTSLACVGRDGKLRRMPRTVIA